jgi:hypothetical protein
VPALEPFVRPMDLEFGPDGAFYLIQWGHVFGTGGVSTVNRVAYNANPGCLDADSDVGGRTVEIGREDTTVADVVVGAGCSINQLIRDEDRWRSQSRFLEHVEEVVDRLIALEAITAEQAEEILAAAERSRIGGDDDDD